MWSVRSCNTPAFNASGSVTEQLPLYLLCSSHDSAEGSSASVYRVRDKVGGNRRAISRAGWQSQGNPVLVEKFSGVTHLLFTKQNRPDSAAAVHTGGSRRNWVAVFSSIHPLASPCLCPLRLLYTSSLGVSSDTAPSLTPFLCLCSLLSPLMPVTACCSESDLWELRAQITCTPSRTRSPVIFPPLLFLLVHLIEREALRPGNEANGNICLCFCAFACVFFFFFFTWPTIYYTTSQTMARVSQQLWSKV